MSAGVTRPDVIVDAAPFSDFVAEYEIRTTSKESGQEGGQRYRCLSSGNGRLVELIETRPSESGESTYSSSSFWDGMHTVTYRTPGNYVTIDRNRSPIDQVLHASFPPSMMAGYLPGDTRSVWSIAKETRVAQTESGGHLVGKIATTKLEFHAQGYGLYQLWYDSNERIIAATVVKRIGDLWNDVPLGESDLTSDGTIRVEVVLEDLQEVSGGWTIPRSAGVCVTATDHEDDPGVSVRQRVELTRFDRLADGVELGRFVQLIPDHTPVLVGRTQADGVPTEWVGGRVQAMIPQATGELIRAELSRCKQGGFPQSGLPVVARLEANRADREVGPYCGVNCVFAAAVWLEHDVEYSDLIRPEYIGDPEGSSISELMQSIGDMGLVPVAYENIDAMSLVSVRDPLVLHVRPNIYAPDYSHFVLLLGLDEDVAYILDPPLGVQGVPLVELKYLWNGLAVAVSRNGDSPGEPISTGRTPTRVLLFLAFAVGTLLVMNRFGRSDRAATAFGGASVVLTGAIALAVVWSVIDPQSFVRSQDTRRLMNRYSAGREIERVTVGQFTESMNEYQVIDARPAREFKVSHVPGAINIPADIARPVLLSRLSVVDRSEQILVYCSNERCGIADLVARLLIDAGYWRVAVLDGGWAEWQETTGERD